MPKEDEDDEEDTLEEDIIQSVGQERMRVQSVIKNQLEQEKLQFAESGDEDDDDEEEMDMDMSENPNFGFSSEKKVADEKFPERTAPGRT